LLPAYTTADSIPNLKDGHQVTEVLQDHTYAPSTLDTLSKDVIDSAENHLEETTTRKLSTRRRRHRPKRRPRWIPKLSSIPEGEPMTNANVGPTRHAKKNVASAFVETTGASEPRETRPPIQRHKGSRNVMKDMDDISQPRDTSPVMQRQKGSRNVINGMDDIGVISQQRDTSPVMQRQKGFRNVMNDIDDIGVNSQDSFRFGTTIASQPQKSTSTAQSHLYFASTDSIDWRKDMEAW
jgi:hypothetical protein